FGSLDLENTVSSGELHSGILPASSPGGQDDTLDLQPAIFNLVVGPSTPGSSPVIYLP
ncbi:hypothetical protein Dimus_036703, partial [Dionaea muscipula]